MLNSQSGPPYQPPALSSLLLFTPSPTLNHLPSFIFLLNACPLIFFPFSPQGLISVGECLVNFKSSVQGSNETFSVQRLPSTLKIDHSFSARTWFPLQPASLQSEPATALFAFCLVSFCYPRALWGQGCCGSHPARPGPSTASCNSRHFLHSS